MEHREHDPGPAGLLHTGLETSDAGSYCALSCCHCYLVVSWLLEGSSFAHVDSCLLRSFLFASRWLPESARWLLVSGQAEKAKKCLVQCAKMNRKHENISALDIEVKLKNDSTSLMKESH